MFFNLIQNGIAFVQANLVVVGMIMSIVAYFRLAIKVYPWCQAWMITAFAFLLAFLFAIPAGGFVLSAEFVIHFFMLGLAATGIYKTGSAIAEKAKDL
jgi:hypothetical protein